MPPDIEDEMTALQDHFRPPLGPPRRHWHSFHSAWATYISSDLNGRLPERYFAEPNVQFSIEIDVAVYDEAGLPTSVATPADPASNGWIAPAPTQGRSPASAHALPELRRPGP